MSNLILAAIILGIGVFVKSSGFPLFITAIGALVVYFIFEKISKKQLLLFAIIGAAIVIPWIIRPGSVVHDDTFHLQFIEPGLVVVYNKVVMLNFRNLSYLIWRRLLTYADWHLLYFALIYVVIAFYKTIFDSKLKYLFLTILINIGMIYYIFGHQAYFIWLVDGTMIQRLMMHFSPVVLFFVALAYEGAKENVR